MDNSQMICNMFRKLFLISACLIFAWPLAAQDDTKEIRKSVIAFIDGLSAQQKNKAIYDFADTSRMKWNNLPVGMRQRPGINIGSLTDQQRIQVHRILSYLLSSQGYLKATSIMHLDNLSDIYYDTLYSRKIINDSIHKIFKAFKWSNENYYISFFGDVKADTSWGFKFEGHHLSLNYTSFHQYPAFTPMFVGTDPAEMPISEYAGWRVLGEEEDLGIKLISILSDEQKKTATRINEVPADIITGAESGKRLIENWGIKGSDLDQKQLEVLKNIIREFVFNLELDEAKVEFDKILKSGIENVYFGWIGPYDETRPHYYLLNGPTFLIEFDNSGPQKKGNHIHAIWREKGNEFGEDILKIHYQNDHHK